VAASAPSLPPAPGRLLVATPTLEDPNFHRSVVLLLASGPEGALGVVLNRPNEIPVHVLLPGWEDLALAPDSMFVGGPVARDSLICLGRLRSDGEVGDAPGVQPVTGRLASLDLNRQPSDVALAVEGIRVFSGYSGWDAAQLDGELQTGSWIVVESDLEDAFTASPADLWARVLRRQGGHYAIYAKAPPKLSMN
jgi:putative transcriptional regulator